MLFPWVKHQRHYGFSPQKFWTLSHQYFLKETTIQKKWVLPSWLRHRILNTNVITDSFTHSFFKNLTISVFNSLSDPKKKLAL